MSVPFAPGGAITVLTTLNGRSADVVGVWAENKQDYKNHLMRWIKNKDDMVGFNKYLVKKKLRFTLNMENLLSKDKKKLRRQDPSMSIKDWLRDLSQESGHSQMMLKSGMSNLKTDFLPSTWVK